MRKLLQYGGIAASIVLIAFGIGAVYMGIDGRSQVRSDLAREQIVGTADSTIPGQKVDTGAEAQAFAAVIRKHTLEATGGQTYAQMDRFLDKNGKPTSDEKLAAIDPESGKPVENGLRNMWVNATALSTALNTAYFAESVATFAIVMGIALLLSGHRLPDPHAPRAEPGHRPQAGARRPGCHAGARRLATRLRELVTAAPAQRPGRWSFRYGTRRPARSRRSACPGAGDELRDRLEPPDRGSPPS